MKPKSDPRAVNAAEDLRRVDRLSRLLDSRYRIPGTGIRFGLETIVGLIPGIGDTLTLLPAAWIIWKAREHGAPTQTLMKMAGNSGIDYVVGSIPIVGDLFDLGFKSNLRNADLLREHLSQVAGDIAPPDRKAA